MIIDSFYLSEGSAIDRLSELTGLSQDEIEGLVGTFTKASSRAGLYRGEVVVHHDGSVTVRHHFTKKKIWSNKEDNRCSEQRSDRYCWPY